MDSQSHIPGTNENKILDLTNQEDEGGEEEGPDYICEYCEIPMLRPNEDLSTVNGVVVVKRGSYYCSKCGMVWDSLDQQEQRVIKSQERTGPRVPKPSDNDFFFESIPSDTGLQPTHNEEFDPEP